MSKRMLDVLLSSVALVILAPLMATIAVWIKLDAGGPIFFRQTRVGRSGKYFRIVKFRTMRESAGHPNGNLTVADDERITRSGAFLRRHKLDELPQLLNVVRGDMSLVGPRPEVPEYVECYPEVVREEVLSVRPGMTDFAALEFIDESSLLGDRDDADRAYRTQVLPAKLALYRRYVREHGLWVDFRIIVRTMVSIFLPLVSRSGAKRDRSSPRSSRDR